MNKIKQKNRMDPEIPTGSFADIAFLLLVFFMLTTVIAITRGIWFKVPEQAPPEEQPKDQKNPAIYIHVNQAGTLMVDKKPLSLNEIKPYCKQKLLVNQNKPIIIHCEGNQPYQKMIEVLDKVKQVEDEMWGDFNKGKPLKEQKRIKLTIPSLEEASAYAQ